MQTGAAGDAAEREADAVAEQVVRPHAQGATREPARTLPPSTQVSRSTSQRKELSSSTILAKLGEFPFFHDKLSSDNPQGQVIADHVKKVIANYDKHFKHSEGEDAEMINELNRGPRSTHAPLAAPYCQPITNYPLPIANFYLPITN